mmetsp:Transcript_14217/g.39411  ORF Transcript_14217/g.39411 Transcript_14217/m.39411 type:complete len:174 (-) Transcript_14217:2302-2823(-)
MMLLFLFLFSSIKPDNILVAAASPKKGMQPSISAESIRLCDFGLCAARGIGGRGSVLLEGGHVMGTANFFAPELSLDTTIVDGTLADMWSAGATLLELAWGFPPEWTDAYEVWDEASNFLDEMDAFLKPYREEELEPVTDLLFKHLLVPPDQRIHSVNVLFHPWLCNDQSLSR